MRNSALRATTALALLAASVAQASETITYSYDARGRLIQVAHSGTVNAGVTTSYSYDKADNRTNFTESGVSAPAISVADASVTEGGTLSFTVTRSGSTSGAVTVDYATADGTATAGSDYVATSGTVSFAAGETTKTITVTTIDDALQESNETVLVNLTNPTGGATISDNQAVGTIVDNDTPPSISISDTSVTEGGALSFTVTRAGPTTGAVSVDYATADGTATAGSDYTAASGTVSFAAGETTKTITVSTIDDAVQESNETVLVNLTNPTGGATISDSQGVGTILDNDMPLTLAISDAPVVEGGNMSFTVTVSGPHPADFSVDYATADGTATAGSDYKAASKTLLIHPQNSTITISVSTLQDRLVEGNETFTVNLSNATGGATITDAQGVGTIIDDD